MHTETFSIATTVKGYPKLPYEKIKNDVLGKHYVLSLVFIGERRARALNVAHRNRSYIPNVLSFPYDKDHGEICIAPTVAARESKAWDMTPKEYTGYLFIHGLLHLKGHRHGATMEKAEKRYLKRHILS